MQQLVSEPVDRADVLGALRDAIGEAADLPVGTWSRREVGEWICDLQEVRSLVDSLLCETTAAAHDASVPVLDSLRNVPSFVSANTNVDPKVVASDRLIGSWLQAFPLFADAFRAGRMTRRHVQALRAEDNRRTHVAMVDAQDYLAAAAADCGWRDFTEALRTWVLAADPDGDEPREQLDERKVTAHRRPDGMVAGTFLLDPLAGTVAMNALDQECGRLRTALAADADGEEAAGVAPAEPSAAQLRADALVSLLGRGATRPDGTTAAPLLHIVMSERVAADVLQRIGVGGDRFDPDARAALLALGTDPDRLPVGFDVDSRCELVDGTPIHPRLAAAALSVATLRRLVMGADSEVLDLGRGSRCYPRHLKDALLAAARGRCEMRGCDAPVGWLEADHLMPWNRDGRTATRNGRIKCRPHNMAKGDSLPP